MPNAPRTATPLQVRGRWAGAAVNGGRMSEAPSTVAAMTYLSFPRQFARTQRFTLGAPRSFAVAPGGERVAFIRSRSGTERTQLLWVLDVPATADAGAAGAAGAAPGTGGEWIAADPAALLGGGDEELSAAERARRERSREGSAGVVGFAVDRAVEVAAFALSGRLFVADLRAPGVPGNRDI